MSHWRMDRLHASLLTTVPPAQWPNCTVGLISHIPDICLGEVIITTIHLFSMHTYTVCETEQTWDAEGDG